VSALTDLLTRLNACTEAVVWAETQPDLATAWNACERGDWMLWLAGRVAVKREDVVLAACACARSALVHVPAGEDCPRVAIETAERWARGEATLHEVRAAAGAAEASAWAAEAAAWSAGAAGRTQSLAHSAALVRGIIPASAIVAAVEGL